MVNVGRVTRLQLVLSDDDHAAVAYIDESKKPERHWGTGAVLEGRRYAAAAAVVMRGDASNIRRSLEQIAAAVGVDQIHYSDLTRARQEALARDLGSLADWDGLVTVTERSALLRHDRTVRTSVLTSQLPSLVQAFGVEEAVIESRTRRLDRTQQLDKDDLDLAQGLRDTGLIPADFRVRHAGKDEPLLWLADFLASSCTDYVCGVNAAPWALLAHRVRLERVPVRAVKQP